MANISRRYIENCGEVFREDILEHAQKRAMVLREMLENLRRKYNELDSLFGKILPRLDQFDSISGEISWAPNLDRQNECFSCNTGNSSILSNGQTENF